MGWQRRFHDDGKRLFRMCSESILFLHAYIFSLHSLKQFQLKSMKQISHSCSNNLKSKSVSRAPPPARAKWQQCKVTSQNIDFFAHKSLWQELLRMIP
ncbi:hypothetical protein CDL12_15959 [Handroanthus impetiginosus]|uniref:Uncharacterized protein n=1 Tax=Handroanthus impetiginosus TaxID=429701 RepID=A0A2G9H2A0_9LAMI|nr:hypothetical protein CDL12_15959 [Handroanthus impetiginosus]